MSKRSTSQAAKVLAAIAGVTLAATVPPAAHASSQQNQDLAAVRAATAQYHNETAAIADGYVPTDECVAVPGVGAMGYHYFNPQRAGSVDLSKPALLIYQPRADGGRKLVAVEYFKPDADQNLATDEDRPHLFDGVPFDGPMEGHEPGMPIHYDLHVWVWQHNPSGMFAQFNPAGSC